MKFLQKKSIAEIPPASGSVSDTLNVTDKVTNAPSIRLVQEMIGNSPGGGGGTDSVDVPTKTSELENDSGFITADDIPDIPTKTSQLENDSGFITENDIPDRVSDSWTADDETAIAPSINLLKNMFKRVTTSLSVPTMSAGAKGYFSVDITIPTGYKAVNVIIRTGQVATSNGLQLTPIYGHDLTTGSQTLRINYHAPAAITASFSCTIHIICMKTELVP